MENPLLDSNIIDKNNRDYVFLAQVSQSDETLRILIDEMQFKIKFTSDNKTYLKCPSCDLLYVLQNNNNLEMSIFYQKQQKIQKNKCSNKCQQCQQFINQECFKKCFKCNSKQIICFSNEEQRLFCQICFSELCQSCDSNLEIFQQFSDKCTQKNVTNCQRYFYVISMILISFIFLPIFIVLNFQKYKFQCKLLQFHQYILTKYKPVVILFFYQVFLIVYLVKVFMILISFVVDKNKERIHYYFG